MRQTLSAVLALMKVFTDFRVLGKDVNVCFRMLTDAHRERDRREREEVTCIHTRITRYTVHEVAYDLNIDRCIFSHRDNDPCGRCGACFWHSVGAHAFMHACMHIRVI